MCWFLALFSGHGVAAAVVALTLTIVLGLAIGLIPFKGIRIGVGGVLFSGLFLSHWGLGADPEILHFVREFGLILFVFSIGMQVGPGFVDSLRRRGLRLNILAAVNVFAGVAVTVVLFFLCALPLPIAVGLFSGAVTNTPSLAAASQVFMEIMPDAASQAIGEAGLAYAIAYPFGIFGIILTMLLTRAVFRADPAKELAAMEEEEKRRNPPLETMDMAVTNANLFGIRIKDIPGLKGLDLVISRVRGAGENAEILAATPDILLHKDMTLHAVGAKEALKQLQMIIGEQVDTNLCELPGPLSVRRMAVTRSSVAGKTPKSLHLLPAHGVTITRVIRAGTEFAARPGSTLHFGDRLICVGTEEALDRAEKILGNSTRDLNHPHVLPIFLGILLGTILGSIPVAVPGLPSGVKLGLAGGPLLVAILLSRVHHVAGMTWYLPMPANLVLREVGIALFLACVGLNAGAGFMPAIMSGAGFYWMAAGACITFIPLCLTAALGKFWFGIDYVTTCGLLAGSMTDPPAIAFASQMLNSDAPMAVYATVYPLTMILRILMGQLLVLGLFLFI
ncbi:conserved membrane hypothetical protein [uncultured delta proteobacterium]|uniref:RCK C-terminal domain-containing protein n=1 Tax=uncultured delta proteobacterium TaxID=34034 RepID=A0A212JVM8_9DELT|nr:conserved membrane hypothetical protein [uncultured delta proteobacterium]